MFRGSSAFGHPAGNPNGRKEKRNAFIEPLPMARFHAECFDTMAQPGLPQDCKTEGDIFLLHWRRLRTREAK